MWRQLAQYNNNFLQTQLKHLSPECVNELQNKEMKQKQRYRNICNMIDRENVTCHNSNYFENRAELAYGFWALPKLVMELGKNNPEIRWKAINSLSEYLANPLHAQRAIKYNSLIRKCQNIFLRMRKNVQPMFYKEIESLLKLFYQISLQENGVYELLRFPILVQHLYISIKDHGKYRKLMCKILPQFSININNIDYLMEKYNVMELLYEIFNEDVCAYCYPSDLWLHLSNILEHYPDEAVEIGFFEILFTRINGYCYKFHLYDLKCFALLLRCTKGQQLFAEKDGVKFIYEILTCEKLCKKINTYENVVLTLMNGLFKREVMLRCREFTTLPKIITKLAKNNKNITQQLFCLQCLREMGEMLCIKRYMKKHCFKILETIQCDIDVNEKQRCELIYWLYRERYHISNLRENPIFNVDEDTDNINK